MKLSKNISFLFLLLTLVSAGFITAQINSGFTSIQFDSRKGLKQNSIHNLLYIRNNRILINTFNGLVKFDGNRFSEIPFSKSDNTKFYPFLAKTSSPEKHFVAHANGSCFQIYPNVTPLRLPAEIRNIKQMVEYHNTIYFVSGANELFNYNVATKKFTKHVLRRRPIQNLSLRVTPNHIYIIIDNNLYHSNQKLSDTSKVNADYPLSGALNQITESANGNLFILEKNKIFTASKTGLYFNCIFTKPDSIPLNFTGIASDPSGNLFICTFHHLYYLPNGSSQLKKLHLSAQTVHIRNLSYHQEQKQLLVGTNADGLFVVKPNVIHSFTDASGFVSSACSSIINGPDSTIYLGTLANSLFTYKRGIISLYNDTKSDYTCLQFVNGELWHGQFDGKIIFGGTNTSPSQSNYIKINSSGSINTILYCDSNTIWVGHSDGLTLLNSKKKIVKDYSAEIKTSISCLKKLDTSTIIAAGKSHIYFIKDRKVASHFSAREGLSVADVRCVHKTASGMLLFGTYGKGIFILRNNQLVNINEFKGCLLPADVFCMVKDKNNTIWMTGNSGLYAINEQLLEKFIKRQLDLLIPWHYNTFHGLAVEEFNGAFMPNYCFLDSNTLLFPNTKGFSKLNLKMVKQSPVVSPVIEVEDIVINDSLKFLKTDLIEFSSQNNTLRVTFFADNFDPATNLHYQYKLEGLDDRWSTPSTINEAHFHLLPPGNYTFKVRAVDANAYNHKIEEFSFTVTPSFTETLTFKSIVLSSVLLIGLLLVTWRIRSIRRIAEEKNLYEAKIAQVELKALHAQINPHFIFNCLNSIKYCVSEHNFEAADKYIDHFSVLLRRFLEFSDKDSIKVSEETEILTHYLELEKYRFNNKFNYFLEIDPAIRDISIPTNIIQPFVENAIKHGIAHSENLCNLHVKLYINGTSIRCIIDDDGIGREASRKINASFKKHTSKGLGLISDKKDILKKISEVDLNFEIIDKKDELSGESEGTTAIIDIPIHYDKSPNNRRRNNRTESD